MGLDMYLLSYPKIEGMTLYEIQRVSGHLDTHESEQDEVYHMIKDYIKNFQELGRSWRSLQTEVAYWRKTNHIHHWFVENVQNGKDDMGMYEVSKDNITELFGLCEQILTLNDRPDEILPTWGGPFFGRYYYDDFYYSEVERTKSILADLLERFNFDTHYLIYHANW